MPWVDLLEPHGFGVPLTLQQFLSFLLFVCLSLLGGHGGVAIGVGGRVIRSPLCDGPGYTPFIASVVVGCGRDIRRELSRCIMSRKRTSRVPILGFSGISMVDRGGLLSWGRNDTVSYSLEHGSISAINAEQSITRV